MNVVDAGISVPPRPGAEEAAAPQNDDANTSSCVVLPPLQASKTTFPIGCPVLFPFDPQQPDGALGLGIVKSIYLDIGSPHRELMHHIQICSSSSSSPGAKHQQSSTTRSLAVVGERSLRYAPQCPVFVSNLNHFQLVEEMKRDPMEGFILSGRKSSHPQEDEEVLYSVLIKLDAERYVEFHDINYDLLQFRPNAAATTESSMSMMLPFYCHHQINMMMLHPCEAVAHKPGVATIDESSHDNDTHVTLPPPPLNVKRPAEPDTTLTSSNSTDHHHCTTPTTGSEEAFPNKKPKHQVVTVEPTIRPHYEEHHYEQQQHQQQQPPKLPPVASWEAGAAPPPRLEWDCPRYTVTATTRHHPHGDHGSSSSISSSSGHHKQHLNHHHHHTPRVLDYPPDTSPLRRERSFLSYSSSDQGCWDDPTRDDSRRMAYIAMPDWLDWRKLAPFISARILEMRQVAAINGRVTLLGEGSDHRNHTGNLRLAICQDMHHPGKNDDMIAKAIRFLEDILAEFCGGARVACFGRLLWEFEQNEHLVGARRPKSKFGARYQRKPPTHNQLSIGDDMAWVNLIDFPYSRSRRSFHTCFIIGQGGCIIEKIRRKVGSSCEIRVCGDQKTYYGAGVTDFVPYVLIVGQSRETADEATELILQEFDRHCASCNWGCSK